MHSRDKGKCTLAYPLIVMHALGLPSRKRTMCCAKYVPIQHTHLFCFFARELQKKERKKGKKAIFAVLPEMYKESNQIVTRLVYVLCFLCLLEYHTVSIAKC